MDRNSRNVDIKKKYAFLLGSALRNDDTEQFFVVYDSLLPKDLDKHQLDSIKKLSREVADCPEEEFNQLVLNARDYSLAPDRTMSHETYKHLDISDDEVYTCKGHFSIQLPEEREKRNDDDSGIDNIDCTHSSKCTEASIYSNESIVSDKDYDSAGDDRQAAAFDYMPSESTHIKISKETEGEGYQLDYDEAHDVDDSDPNSNIDSPRSDYSYGESASIELREFSRQETYKNDFETDEDSEDNEVLEHRKYRTHPRKCRQYYNYDRKPDISFEKSLSSTVDDRIDFPISYDNNSYSEGTKLNKTVYSRHEEYRPPFGGKDKKHFEKIAKSIRPLIEKPYKDPIENLPEGRQLHCDDLISNGKKKKKKRDEPPEKVGLDQNGNPYNEGSPFIDRTQYQQMRLSPNGSKPNKAIENSSADRHKRNKKKKEEKVVKAEDIDNYQGHKNVDDVLKYINNDSNAEGKKSKKPSQASAKEDPASKSSDKASKKNKEKKNRSITSNYFVGVGIGQDKGCAIPHVEDIPPQSLTLQSSSNQEEVPHQQRVSDSVVICVEFDSDEVEISPKAAVTVSDMGNAHPTVEEPSVLYNDISETTQDGKDKRAVKNNNKGANKMKNDKVLESDKLDANKEDKSITKNNKNNKKKVNNLTAASGVAESKKNQIANDVAMNLNSVKNNFTKPSINTMDKMTEVIYQKAKGEDNNMNIHHNSTSSSSSSHDLDSLDTCSMLLSDFDSKFEDATDVHLKPALGFGEEDFQVVGKKKKRVNNTVGVSVVNSRESNTVLNTYVKDTHIPAQIHSKQVMTRNDKPRRPVQRSVTPPPCDKLMNKISDSERLRDLSPSSFPALKSSGREGRRSSTGDLSMKGLDDNDSESMVDNVSVKSFPSASQDKGQGISPRLGVSYASMAASPKPKNAVTKEGGNCEENREWISANWKGSLTERRHSIGSSAETNIIKDSEYSPIKQKYGSQEALCTPSITQDADECVSFMYEELPQKPSKDSTSHEIKAETDHLISAKDLEFIDTTSKCSVTDIASSASTNCVGAEPSIDSDPISSPSNLSITSSHSTSSLMVSKKLHSKATTSSSSDTALSNVKISVPNKANNCLKKQFKNKSVIFLDKRFDEDTKNLGISFGFDSELEEVSFVGNFSENISGGSIENTSLDLVNTAKAPVNKPFHGKNGVILPKVSIANHSCPSSASSKSESQSEIKNIDVSQPHLDPVSVSKESLPEMPQLSAQQDVSSEVVSQSEPSCETVEKKSVKCPLSDSTEVGSNNVGPSLPANCVLMEYCTDPLCSPSCAKALLFIPESEAPRGRFNMMEAVRLMSNEWERYHKDSSATTYVSQGM